MTTFAAIGLGTTFQMADVATPTVFTDIGEIFNLSPPAASDETVDATHYGSPNRTREYIPGLTDLGEASFEMNYVPGSAADLYLLASKGIAKVCKITFPNGVTVTFTGIRQSYEPSVPVDDRMTVNVAFKVSGLPVQGAAAAPTNTLLPSISGVLTSGSLLTANEGLWTGAPSYTYQWKRGGVDIAGATSKTYTLAAPDVGTGTSVVVTGTNSVGNAAATSPRTANIT